MRKKLHRLFLALMATVSTMAYAQDTTISGKVTDSSGEALYGVNVTVKGTTKGTITGEGGSYSLSASPSQTLTFSYIGFDAQDILVGNQTSINVSLSENASVLGEVVVTAFGIEKEKKALGYSVTQIEGSKFTESRTTNIGNALSGKVAGVNVSTPATGAAGSSRVVIRGGSSLSGNDEPLYVINGVPMDNTNQGQAGVWGGNDSGNGLSAINPDDIESMSVLKGNSASALYGARASNGVILITTKSGKGTQGLGVSFNSNYTFDKAIDRTDLQNEYGYGIDGIKPTSQAEALDQGGSSWGAKLDGSQVIGYDGISRPYSAVNEDINDFYSTGSTWSNTLGLSGGNEVGSFRFSASNLQNDDIMPNSGFDRTTFNGNMNGKFGKLELQASGQYSLEEAKNRPRLSDAPGNANYTVLTKAPNLSFNDIIGDPNKLGAQEDGFENRYQSSVYNTNPYWAAYQFYRLDNKNRFFGNASLTYHLTDWLFVKGRLGTDYTAARYESTEPYGTAYTTAGGYNLSNRAISENNADIFVGFNKSFGQFDVDGLFGGTRMRKSYENTGVGGNGLNIPFFGSLTNVANQTYSYQLTESGINSVYGALNFSYGNYLFLTLTGRNDTFSTLSPADNSVFYPSASLGYAFSDNMKNKPSWLTFGKARVSWAQVGGGDPAPYSNLLTYGLQGYQHNGAILGTISNGTIPNNGLSPYLSSEIEIGLDLRFFKNRLGLDLVYYDRNTKDDILSTTISNTSGYTATQINIGELENKGIEILLTGNPIRTDNFSWNTTLNFAKNTSNVVSLGENAQGEAIEFLNLDESRLQQERIRHYVGDQLGVIAGYTHKTIDGQKVYDDNGYPVRGDFEKIALGRHPISAGWTNEFSYKNFNLSFMIDIRQGGSMMSGTNVGLYGLGLHKETLVGRENGLTITGVTNAGEAQTWEIAPENVDNYYDQYNNITEYFVYDASFGKLRELSLGYSIPQTLLERTPLKTMRLSAVGRNLALLWSSVPNVDPESGYSSSGGAQGLEYFAMPTTRSLGFNLSATF
ncbi:SusC/RagA family TonB-linked outer membrane protein [Arcticibacterium luteifluviistationis]|uniref:SusC/RagA family TonB-linked outer membrane protein n=1 Tax=Arcticibacterium luteifluviistationis TaxID=1784714 RepID=A0A2Z4GCJ5_9BACT|nr:SusC/RagA family TonB-linked outer membrane protein [Arcticibacterium luteifluviistationis]AWV99022.1 SusC/RagA family TonB-linked outer membrane protein [Arcticibacterium luteifluviistationis]